MVVCTQLYVGDDTGNDLKQERKEMQKTKREMWIEEEQIWEKRNRRIREGKRERERANEHEIRSCCIIMACRPSQCAMGLCRLFPVQYHMTL